MDDQQYAIGAGYNMPLISLVRISVIIPTDDIAFASPKGTPLYNPGSPYTNTNGVIATTGFRKQTWRFDFMTYEQWAYLSSTYCSGGISGPVTILTTLGSSTFYRMNAIIDIKQPTVFQSSNWYQRVDIDFTRLAAAS